MVINWLVIDLLQSTLIKFHLCTLLFCLFYLYIKNPIISLLPLLTNNIHDNYWKEEVFKFHMYACSHSRKSSRLKGTPAN